MRPMKVGQHIDYKPGQVIGDIDRTVKLAKILP